MVNDINDLRKMLLHQELVKSRLPMRYSTKEAVRRGMARDSEQLAPRRGSDGAAFEEANIEKDRADRRIVEGCWQWSQQI